jgi:hypothetical protein
MPPNAVSTGVAMMLKSLGIDPNELFKIGENLGAVAQRVLENQETIIKQNTEILELLKQQKGTENADE